jgi:hypothetical protein
MKKQIFTSIGNGEIAISSDADNADTYYITTNRQTGKYYYWSEQGINTAFQTEFKSLEAAIKSVRVSIENA